MGKWLKNLLFIVVFVSTRSPKLIEIAKRSPFKYCNAAQPGPCKDTTGILNSLQQLHNFDEQLQYLFAAVVVELVPCRFLLPFLSRCFLITFFF